MQEILSAFITFETEEGYNEALRFIDNPDFLKNDQKLLLGSKLKMEDADEPGNIIWESKHIKGFNLFKRVMFGLGMVAVILIISFSVIVTLQTKSVELDRMYPKIDCVKLQETYIHENIRNQAGNDYLQQKLYNDEVKSGETETLAPRVGALRCYCENFVRSEKT